MSNVFPVNGLEPLGCPTPGACSCNCDKQTEALQKQLAAAKEDAARYRYLRNPNTTLVVSGMVVDGLNLTTLPLFEQQLDDAIDSKLDHLELK